LSAISAHQILLKRNIPMAYETQEQKLDGKTPVKPTPFDAHEQATRGTHIPTKAGDKEPHPGQGAQYPKVVEHREGSEKGQLDAAVIVNSKEEEDAYLAKKAKEEKAEKSA
jgi:hypothetical protein